MKQVYYPYNKWEEVKFDMYKTISDKTEKYRLLQLAIKLLSDPEKLKKTMISTTVFWPRSTERNMTCPSVNKQAWLGQAACCINDNVPANITKEAWSLLTDEQRKRANAVADEIVKEWNKNYAKNI